MQFELEKQNVRFHAEISPIQDVRVSMDRDKFKRVLNNVIENSIKYMDSATNRLN